MSTRIRITRINTSWSGQMLERYMNETLLLRTARKVGDEENVNNYVLGQLNRHQESGEISFEKVCLEKWYEVKRNGVVECIVDPEELKKSHSWLVAHDFNGRLIFENYSRAMLCWYERRDRGCLPEN